MVFVTPFYNDVLSSSGYRENLTYQKDLLSSKKVRQRKIIWLKPPYRGNVETNISKTFLKLIDKHFPKTMHLNYVKVLVLLENRQSWRETLGSKFVSFGCSTHLINVLNTLIPDISTPIPNIYIYIYNKCIWTIYIHYRATLNYYFELFEPTTTKFRSDALIDWAISYWAIATPISSFVQCQISFWLLPSSVATFILIEVSWGNHMSLAELTDTYDIQPWRILWSSYRKLDFNQRLLNSSQTL